MKAHKLDPEFKAKWIAALRSGEYKQGCGYLWNEDTNEYCCLGVACAISGADFRKIDGNYPSNKNENIPSILRGRNKITVKLAYMNDGINRRKKSFLEIADWIETNL